MKKYKLTSVFCLVKIDNDLFIFQNATLFVFNDSGFDLLLELLDGVTRNLDQEEVEMVDKLLVGGIIEECS